MTDRATISDQEPMPITVNFKTQIRTDGGLVQLSITQGQQAVYLTTAQTEALFQQIGARRPNGTHI